MKGKRSKHRKKCLTFYKHYFGYRPPYQVLIDGTFCKAALSFKVNIMEQLPKYLDAEVRYFTTKCVMAECEALGTLLYGPLKVLRQFRIHPCRHAEPVRPIQCLRSVLREHKHKFMVATQDQKFQEELRSESGVPLMYIAYNAIIMDPPTDKSKNKAEKKLHDETSPTDYAAAVIKKLKTETFGEVEEKVKKKKKRKIKGPNPLSCKKKKKTSDTDKDSKKKKKKKSQKAKITLESLAENQSS